MALVSVLATSSPTVACRPSSVAPMPTRLMAEPCRHLQDQAVVVGRLSADASGCCRIWSCGRQARLRNRLPDSS